MHEQGIVQDVADISVTCAWPAADIAQRIMRLRHRHHAFASVFGLRYESVFAHAPPFSQLSIIAARAYCLARTRQYTRIRQFDSANRQCAAE